MALGLSYNIYVVFNFLHNNGLYDPTAYEYPFGDTR
jgi:hypothetical protein